METPFISVAIASYNYAQYLQRGFEAIRRQKYKNFEVVYLDDASTDDSVSYIHNIIDQNPDMSIRIVENDENRGILYSKTRLFRECRGEYVMLCDADDWMADDCLEKLAKAAEDSGADRVVSEVINIGDNGKIIQTQKLPEKPSEWLWNIHHGCLYRRNIILEHGITIDYEPDDVYLITMFNLHCKKTAWIHEPLYYWYVHTDSSGRSTAKNDIAQMTEKFEDMLKYVSYAIDRCDNEESKRFLEILAMKLYYLQIFHSMRYYSLCDMFRGYSSLRGVMEKYFDGYLVSKYNQLSKKYLRAYAYYIIKISRIIERLHLMKPALIGYRILNSIIYIDQ